MNREKIIFILSELYKISGFRVSLHNTNFDEIAAYPEKKLDFCDAMQTSSDEEYKKCKDCDKAACKKALSESQTIIYKCRHGLVEAISPLYNFGALTGYLMMGQVRVRTDDVSKLLYALRKIGKAESEAFEIVDSIPSVANDMIRSYVNIMTICASYLTLSNSVTGAKPTVGQMTMRFISENYTDRLTIKDICDAVGYSKSTVLSSFKKEFSTTVNAYLNNMRLERSKKMLEDDSATINEIALKCGFSDQSYFSKVFSTKYGITPTDYRRGDKQ
jgi:AraC-like DNA-binding protein